MILLLLPVLCSAALLSQTPCVNPQPYCPEVPSYLKTAFLAQRDASYNVTIDQLTAPGISLQQAIFDPYGYNDTGLEYTRRALGFGFRSFFVDLYWLATNQTFQLCPDLPANGSASCDISLMAVLNLVEQFVVLTDNSLSVSLWYLQLRLHDLPNNHYSGPGSYSLSTVLTSAFASPRIYTPLNLSSDRQAGHTFNATSYLSPSPKGFPIQNQLVAVEQKRIVVSAVNVSLPAPGLAYSPSTDANSVFVLDHESAPLCPSPITNTVAFDAYVQHRIQNPQMQVWNAVFDTLSNQTSNLTSTSHPVSECGLSLVLQRPVASTDDFIGTLEAMSWSWATNQPQVQAVTPKPSSPESSPVAFSCAAMSGTGWNVVNCYQALFPLCRSANSSLDWALGSQRQSYFRAADSDQTSCPPGSFFAVPQTALQNSMALSVAPQSEAAWVDFNTISTSNCWVTGGPFSVCPYVDQNFGRQQVRLFGVAAGMSLLLVLIVALLRLDSVPSRGNLHKWRRLLAKQAEIEYEGVPE